MSWKLFGKSSSTATINVGQNRYLFLLVNWTFVKLMDGSSLLLSTLSAIKAHARVFLIHAFYLAILNCRVAIPHVLPFLAAFLACKVIKSYKVTKTAAKHLMHKSGEIAFPRYQFSKFLGDHPSDLRGWSHLRVSTSSTPLNYAQSMVPELLSLRTNTSGVTREWTGGGSESTSYFNNRLEIFLNLK